MSIENKKSLKADESRSEGNLNGEHYATVQWLREILFAIGKQVDDAVRSVDEISRNDTMLLADGNCRGAFIRMSSSLVSAIEHFHEAFALVGPGSITAEVLQGKAIGVEEKTISREPRNLEPKNSVQANVKIDLMIEEQYFVGVQLEVPSASLPKAVGHRYLLQIDKTPVMGCGPIVMDDWLQADKRHGFMGIPGSGARAIPR